jgi:bifunctional non-homologous end joining protein LigD
MLWRSSSPRIRRSPPPGFVVPCNPGLVSRPRAGPDWLHEVKHDGYRILARKRGERVTLWTRRGTDYTDRMPRIAEAVRGLPADEALIDGEAVVLRPDGRSDFQALMTKRGCDRGCEQAAYVAFDLLRLDGADIRQDRIEERRTALKRLVSRADAILFSEAIEVEGALVFTKACEMGLEGIVSKRAGSRYVSWNSRIWLKCKNPAFVRM